jgi:hypothetical protein
MGVVAVLPDVAVTVGIVSGGVTYTASKEAHSLLDLFGVGGRFNRSLKKILSRRIPASVTVVSIFQCY